MGDLAKNKEVVREAFPPRVRVRVTAEMHSLATYFTVSQEKSNLLF